MADITKEPNPYTTERAVMMVSMLEVLRDEVLAMSIGVFLCVCFDYFFTAR